MRAVVVVVVAKKCASICLMTMGWGWQWGGDGYVSSIDHGDANAYDTGFFSEANPSQPAVMISQHALTNGQSSFFAVQHVSQPDLVWFLCFPLLAPNQICMLPAVTGKYDTCATQRQRMNIVTVWNDVIPVVVWLGAEHLEIHKISIQIVTTCNALPMISKNNATIFRSNKPGAQMLTLWRLAWIAIFWMWIAFSPACKMRSRRDITLHWSCSTRHNKVWSSPKQATSWLTHDRFEPCYWHSYTRNQSVNVLLRTPVLKSIRRPTCMPAVRLPFQTTTHVLQCRASYTVFATLIAFVLQGDTPPTCASLWPR